MSIPDSTTTAPFENGGGAASALPNSLLLSCGIAVAASTLMSLFSIFLHLKSYRKPLLQRMVVRILIMVPIYGISSLIAIFSLNAAFVIDAIRDIYEAFVIYCFFQLLLAYLGGERSLLILLHGRPPKTPIFPMNLFWHEVDVSDPYTFLFLKRGILQYVQVKPALAIATLVLKFLGVYNEGDLRANSGYLYVTIVYNFSICLSLYCLAIFWMCVHGDLLPFRPMPKFLCIKGIIFFSFWQSLFISLLVAAGAITRVGPYDDSEHISLALTDTLICFEMVLFAVAHQYSFSQKDYIDPHTTYAARMPFLYAFRDAFGMRDVYEDTKATLAGQGMDYKEFEPAEGFMHQGLGRERRIKAGLRYAEGGKKKYWLPMPVPETEPGAFSNKAARALNRHHSEEVYAPLLDDQDEDVVHTAPESQSSDDDEFPSLSHHTGGGDGFSLYFGSPNNSDEDLYGHSRHYVFGDYNYPAIDVSAESARLEMWEEEERILTNERGAFFSPRHEAQKLYFTQQEYGSARHASQRPDSRQSESRLSRSSRSKGKGKQKEEMGQHRDLLINRDDDRLPDMFADGVKLRWTKHGDLKPASSGGSSKQTSPSRSPKKSDGFEEGYTSSPHLSSEGSLPRHPPRNGSPPIARKGVIAKQSDAVDLVVEDQDAAEHAMARERMRGEPAIRGSGLRMVYKQEYVIEDEEGSDKEVEIEEVKDPMDDSIPRETNVKITSDSKGGGSGLGVGKEREEVPHAEVVTEIQVSREDSPPPLARVHVEQRYTEEDPNPWAEP